ncbi:MAG: hypothetical protein JNL69_03105 [Bacteroidia bacterium]|nr:hypothetical protein [Bacteroidia bacterium]
MKTLNNLIDRACGSFLGKKILAFVSFVLYSGFLSADEGEPSLGHLKRTAAAVKEEQEKMAREQLIKEVVYISIGFTIVVLIAWFTTSLARKKAKKDAEEKQRVLTKLHGDPSKRVHAHKHHRR